MSFDLKVQHRDAKTGRVTSVNPYRLHVKGNSKTYERPVGSGNLWYENDEPANEHRAYEIPLTEDQKLASELSAKDSQLRGMEEKLNAQAKELKAIQDESKDKEAKKEAKVEVKAEAKPAPKGVSNGRKAGNVNSNDKT